MTGFAQRREEDDKNLPNHWLWEWVEVTACFPSQRSATFLELECQSSKPCVSLGQRSGWFWNLWVSKFCLLMLWGRQVALLQIEVERYSFDFFQLQRKGWAQWQQVVITFRRSCGKSDKSQRPPKKEELLYLFLLLEEKSVVQSCLRKWLPFLVIAFPLLELQSLATCGWSKVDIGGMRGQGLQVGGCKPTCIDVVPKLLFREAGHRWGDRWALQAASEIQLLSTPWDLRAPWTRVLKAPIFRAYWKFFFEISRIRDLLLKGSQEISIIAVEIIK